MPRKRCKISPGYIHPDAVFLDVEMPGMNGMELAKKILTQDSTIRIIFVTVHERYAIEAFRVNAVDYLLKPITRDELDLTTIKLLKNQSLLDKKPKAINLIKFIAWEDI